MDRIAGILSELEDRMVNSIPRLITNVDLNDLYFMEHVPAYAKNLRAVHAFCNTVGYIGTAIRQLAMNPLIVMEASVPSLSTSRSLVDMMKELEESVKPLLDECIKLENKMFLRYLQEFYGKDYVHRAARVVFNFKKSKPGQPKEPWLKALHDENVSLSDALTYLNNDISFMDRHLTSMANNPDIVGQMVDKVAKFANKRADDATNAMWDELRRLEKTLISGELGTNDTRIFC